MMSASSVAQEVECFERLDALLAILIPPERG
jgi:hypothetical protein